MTTTLIVLAHPERRSFNGAWAEASAEASRRLGHKVLWSDLCGQRFDAVERAEHYAQVQKDQPFDPLKAQGGRPDGNGLPRDVAGEIAKLQAADRVIFHFPLWWFAPPAVLKGWFDRVLVHGALHSVDERFDRGRFLGRKAMFCVTTGATEVECGPGGKEGDLSLLLWPVAYTLRYLGFTVLDPVSVHGVHGYHEGAAQRALQARLTAALAAQEGVIAGFDARPALRFNADAEFDAQGRLRPDAASHSPFIRREG